MATFLRCFRYNCDGDKFDDGYVNVEYVVSVSKVDYDFLLFTWDYNPDDDDNDRGSYFVDGAIWLKYLKERE